MFNTKKIGDFRNAVYSFVTNSNAVDGVKLFTSYPNESATSDANKAEWMWFEKPGMMLRITLNNANRIELTVSLTTSTKINEFSGILNTLQNYCMVNFAEYSLERIDKEILAISDFSRYHTDKKIVQEQKSSSVIYNIFKKYIQKKS